MTDHQVMWLLTCFHHTNLHDFKVLIVSVQNGAFSTNMSNEDKRAYNQEILGW